MTSRSRGYLKRAVAGVLRVPAGSPKRLRGPTARLVLGQKQVPRWLHGIPTGSLVEVREGRERQLVSMVAPLPTKGDWVVEPFLTPVEAIDSAGNLAPQAIKERKSGGLAARAGRR
mgnify:CR=1 FL=1